MGRRRSTAGFPVMHPGCWMGDTETTWPPTPLTLRLPLAWHRLGHMDTRVLLALGCIQVWGVAAVMGTHRASSLVTHPHDL